jgi:predicted neuraminidase
VQTGATTGSTPRRAFWGAPRAPLTLALSDDDGRTWPWQRHLETGDGYCMTNNSADKRNREYSYPSITQTSDGAIHLAYTVFRQHIRHARVSEAWVMQAHESPAR